MCLKSKMFTRLQNTFIYKKKKKELLTSKYYIPPTQSRDFYKLKIATSLQQSTKTIHPQV
jgi:hypothetical protein